MLRNEPFLQVDPATNEELVMVLLDTPGIYQCFYIHLNPDPEWIFRF